MAIETIFHNPTSASFPGLVAIHTDTQIQIVAGSVTQNYFGFGFTYSQSGQVTAGTLTSTDLSDSNNGGLQYSITGLNHSAATVYTYVSNGSTVGLNQYLLNGDDTINGSSENDYLFGWTGSDIIFGAGGNDVFDDSFGAQSIDTFVGGPGDDTYIIGFSYSPLPDIVVEAPGEGIDTVQSAIDFVLPANVENLTLLDDGARWINGTGNALANTLIGTGGNNVLDGGTGADIMQGFQGDDTYIVDNPLDIVTDTGGDAGDTVKASIDGYVLGAAIENLVLIGPATSGSGNQFANKLTGNALDNTLNGNSGDDTLDGGGGMDTLIGGAGNDVYIVNAADAILVESPGDGTDSVWSSVSFTLPANVESLTLYGTERYFGSGTDPINGTGNELDNILYGSGGANILEGGPGNDTLDGWYAYSGADTAVYSGTRFQYLVWKIPGSGLNGVIVVDLRPGSPDGTDRVSNVGLFQFADGTYTYGSLGATDAPSNQPPLNTVPGSQTAGKGMANVIGGISIDDDAGPLNVTLTLSETHGTIAVNSAVAGGVGAGNITGNNTSSITMTGTVAKINITLADAAGVTYTPTAGFVGFAQLTVTTNDNGNIGIGGPLTDTDNIGISVEELNSAPVNAVPGTQTMAEDMAKVISGISVIDLDAGASNVTTTLTATSGSIAVNTAAAGGVSAGNIGGNQSGTITLTGTIAQINATLANALGVTYTPTANFNGVALLTVSTNDNGNTGSGGPLIDIDNIGITVTAENDAPTGGASITGTAAAGQVLTADISTLADPDGLGTLNYQWLHAGAVIAGAIASTYTLTQDDVGSAISVRVSYTDGGGTAESVSSVERTANLLSYDWKAHTLLDGISVTAGITTHSTDAGGSTSLTSFVDSSLSLSATRSIPAAEVTLTSQAVNLQDAIAILKMIVGLDVNGAGKALSPYQSLAADYNGDGTVGLTDAIGVLKHVVGLPAPDPVWKFVNEIDASIPGKVGLNPGTLSATITADVSAAVAQVHVGLVGILIGDVDGSFPGALGSLDLDLLQPTYFADLTSAHGLQLSQFGVYP